MTSAPFAYFGGKAGMADLIVSLMPAHRVYIEPFFGSGAVFFAKPPSLHEIVNDADDVIVTFFRVLRDRRDELEEACALTPYARTEYVDCDISDITDPAGLDDLEVARRFFCRVTASHSKTAGRRTGFSVTTARTQPPSVSSLVKVGRFASCADRLRTVTIENTDAAGLVDRLATSDAVVYCDPPYLASTRVGRPDVGLGDYRTDMLDETAHERLAEVLRSTPATVLLSGYHSPLYDRLYGDWDRIEREVTSHSSNSRRDGRGKRIEVLWSNRPLQRQAEQIGFGWEGVG